MVLYILLQSVELPFLEQYYQLGITGVVAATFIYLFFNERKKNNKIIESENSRIIAETEKEKARLIAEAEKEKARLILEKENSEEKVEVLYNEIKYERKEQNEKIVEVMNKHNEIHEKTVDALLRTTNVVEKNNSLYKEIINLFIKNNIKS